MTLSKHVPTKVPAAVPKVVTFDPAPAPEDLDVKESEIRRLREELG